MPNRECIVGVVAMLIVAGWGVFSVSESAAEPILGMESLDIPTDNKSEKQTPSDALALFKARDYEGSLKLWREAVKKNPDLPPAQTIMAQLYYQVNMPIEAQKALERAMVDAPADPEAYLLIADASLKSRDFSKAESLYQQAGNFVASFGKSAKRKDFLQARLLSGLASLAEARKDWAGSQQSLEALLKMNPKNPAALQRIAYCLFQEKNIDGALEKLREAAKIAPAILTPEAMLSQFYQGAGDRENAEKWLDEALTADPKNLKTRLLAGQKALEAKQFDKARKHAIAAAQIDQKSLDAKLLQAMIATFEKNYMAAELFFDAALRQSPGNVGISNNLALVLVEQGDEAKGRRALEYAEANAKQYPRSPEVASTYGYILYRLGRLDEAEKVLRTAKPIANTDLDTAYILARVAIDRGRKDEARGLLEEGLKTTKLAMFRQEAEELLAELKK